jgi:hypothetical protein
MPGLAKHIEDEIELAEDLKARGDLRAAFQHLERAHVLGQAITYEHTRVHWRMLKLAWASRDMREILGQLLRIVGASTKTPFGIYPRGNTGGANVWFFQRMPIPADLQELLNRDKMN